MTLSKTLLRHILPIVIFAGAVFFLAPLFYPVFKIPIQDGSATLIENTAYPQEQEGERSALPVRLKIPAINVDSPVEHVGVTLGGAMDTPKDRANAAWFDLGPLPGENGSAVIAGHYGWKNGKASAFDNLYKLRKDDKLYTVDEKGMTTVFVVREIRRYDPSEYVPGVFVSSDGKAHLNLITCGGVWNKDQKSYADRLVVFADKV